MKNPVDHTLDLGLVNYVQHPSNQNYIVFRFADPERAASFEEALTDKKIWFEKNDEQKRSRLIYLFGIHKNDFKVVQQINYDVEAKHKKKFIPFPILRYGLLFFSLIVLLLATIGYCKAQNKLSSYEDQDTSLNQSEKSK